MPEVSNMPLLGNLLEQGVRDMVRICDGRMSATAYGTVVLHGAPEAAARGRLGKARTGDMRDAANRHLDVDVSAAEREARELALAAVTAYSAHRRGWERVHVDTVGQANTGGDLDFLLGSSGDRASRESD
jgi:dihydroxyacid dehydratase/phosphogluconate dehydratase